MYLTKPKVYLIGETRILEDNLKEYLEDIGAGEWSSDAPSDCEKIIEVYGKICYRSWLPGLNLNVKKVRKDNKKYIGHIINVGHGSVLECAFTNWIFKDVSRILTAELCRHRIGTHISQESLRFVRLDDIGIVLPQEILENKKALELFENLTKDVEKAIAILGELFDIDSLPFNEKKKITSTMRRLAPQGLATTIGWSANLRTLRHVIEMRTSRHAEWEIRYLFDKVAQIAAERYPNVFADYKQELVDDINEWSTKNRKI